MNGQERVLIAGCGDLGTALGLQLCEQGHQVYGLRRRSEPLPAPLHTLRADLTDRRTLEALPRPLDLLYYIATPAAFDDEAYRLAYVVGLTNLLGSLGETRPRRLVLVSSTAVYGQTSGEWVDEQSPAEPSGFSGRRMREAEQLAENCGIPATIIRFGGIYGPGRTRMIDRVRQGAPCVAEPPQHTNRIHRDDCVGILAHLGRPEVAGGIYLGVDHAPCTQCELMDWLADQLSVPRPARVAGTAGGVRGSNKRVKNERLRASGYSLLYPSYKEGYTELLRSVHDQARNPGSGHT